MSTRDRASLASTKPNDRVAEAAAEVERRRERQGELSRRLAEARPALERLREECSDAFLDGRDIAELDERLPRAERDVVDLESAFEQASKDVAKAQEPHRTAEMGAARVAEQRLALRYQRAVLGLSEALDRASDVASEAAVVHRALDVQGAEVARLGGRRLHHPQHALVGLALRLQDRLATFDRPDLERSIEEHAALLEDEIRPRRGSA